MHYPYLSRNNHKEDGFSLIEVVLAIGIFLVTILALVGLLGPTLQSVDEVEKTDQIASVVNSVNAFLQNSPEIAGTSGTSKFDLIFNAVAGENYATIFVFNEYIDDSSERSRLLVGFHPSETLSGGGTLGSGSQISSSSFEDAAGNIYRVILTPSSVIPDDYRSGTRNASSGTYELSSDIDSYFEGYFAMEVRIYAEEPGPDFISDKGLSEFLDVEPLFTYNTAVVR